MKVLRLLIGCAAVVVVAACGHDDGGGGMPQAVTEVVRGMVASSSEDAEPIDVDGIAIDVQDDAEPDIF